MEMSITRALAELKLLDSRINRNISSAKFVTSNKKSAKNVDGSMTKDEFDRLVKADYQSIMSLIERKKIIKSSIVESNSKTIVIVGGVEMTVASAIERKNNILYEKTLLSQMKNQLRNAKYNVITKNEEVDEKLDSLLETMLGKENLKNIDKESNEFSVKYKNDNEYEIIDPIDIELKIRNLEKEIEDFESEVDYVLSESNTVTKIAIPD